MIRPRRSGFALALAVCLLAAVASLAAASVYATREARRAATRLAGQEEAASLADATLFDLVGRWTSSARDTLPVGGIDSVKGERVGPRAADTYVTRITPDLYSLTAVGHSGLGTTAEARRGHSLLVHVLRPVVAAEAALISRGDVAVGGGAALSGRDRHPPGWDGCPPVDSSTVPSILIPEGRSALDGTGQAIADVRVDSIAADTLTYRAFGRATVRSLAGAADVSVRSGAMVAPRPSADDKCGYGTDIASWGEPFRDRGSQACQRFFPVIHAEDDIVVTAGRGQGLLLVDGHLRIEGPFVFYGLVIAQRGIDVSGAPVSVYGQVLSGAPGGVRWGASGVLQRSTCAVARALASASRPAPIPLRAWSELF